MLLLPMGIQMRSIEPKEKHLAPTPKHQSPCSVESREVSVATEPDEQSKVRSGGSACPRGQRFGFRV